MKSKLFFLGLIILSIIPVLSLFHSGLPITHDGQDHVARIANFYQNLTEGILVPRWAGSLNWGYGHPIIEFLYPLPSYIASFFHFFGLSLIDSTKIVFLLGMVLSFAFMYLWLSRLFGRIPALLGAVLYTYAPYRFVELYVRGDIGENLGFAFMPLILFFMYQLSKKYNYKYILLGGISVAFLILSHNALSLMYLPFIIFYGLYLLYFSKKRKPLLINFVVLIVLGFAVSAFFWIPALWEGKYTLRNIVTAGVYKSNFVNLGALFYGPWNYGGSGLFTVQLGIVQIITLILSIPLIYILIKRKDLKYIFLGGLLIYFFISIFLMLPISNFIWSKMMLLQNFQFPWRLLAIPLFSTAVIGAFFLYSLPKKMQFWIFLLFLFLILLVSKDYWHAKDYLYKPESFFTGIYNSTTDTGESAPRWSIRFMEKRPKAQLEVLDGKAEVVNIERKSTYHLYVVNVENKTLFSENTVYFPGWQILIDGINIPIEFQDPHFHGLMTFRLSPGIYKVEALYKDTKIRGVSNWISILTLISIMSFCSLKIFKLSWFDRLR